METLWKTLRNTAKLLDSQRKLWLPFLATAGVEAVFIAIVWLTPQSSLLQVLGPPIRYFFGEQVLHYPAHLWFLYHVMKHTHMITSTLVGAFLSGVACAMVGQIHAGKPLMLRDAVLDKQVRYGRIMLLWLITWGVATGLTEGLLHVLPKTVWAFWVTVGVTLLFQTLFVYVIPAAVFEGSTWWRALFQGLRETMRYPLSTVVVVALPTSAVILFAVMVPEARVAHWMEQTVPEVAILFTLARLFVWTVTDTVLTVAIAHLWWIHRTSQRVSSPAAVSASAAGVKQNVVIAR